MPARMVCGRCPLSCRLTAVVGSGSGPEVQGHRCPRGREYAERELVDPHRTLTTTARTGFADRPRLPVRTAGEIPLRLFVPALRTIKSMRVEQRLAPGEVLLSDLLGTGVAVIATDGLAEEELTSETTGHRLRHPESAGDDLRRPGTPGGQGQGALRAVLQP
ncbi:MAG TPA: DUF1667 domain-containing protein [Bacillota bacterium]|nr:DUF1667 domain-containing protein [Bacillota bacterium]